MTTGCTEGRICTNSLSTRTPNTLIACAYLATLLQANIFFRFEHHYILARSYCQRVRTPARIPVLEALKCPPPAQGTAEENALYKLIVGGLTR